jgi:hypothetical protein
MRTATAHRTRGASGLLAGVLLLAPLAGCTEDSPDATSTPETTATETDPADEPTEATDSPDSTETGDSGATGGEDPQVDCSGNSCSLTLSGDGARADVLGNTVVLGSVENGQATFRVGSQDLSCGQGETTSVGPLQFECTTVTDDTVTMRATLG